MLTLASATPGTARSARSTRPAHATQLIPSTGNDQSRRAGEADVVGTLDIVKLKREETASVDGLSVTICAEWKNPHAQE